MGERTHAEVGDEPSGEMPSYEELVENRKELALERTTMTEREAEVFARAHYKDTVSEVAREMPLGKGTVEMCINNIHEKLDMDQDN